MVKYRIISSLTRVLLPSQKLEVKRGADGSIILDGLGSDARILESDKVACRSVVHIIDTVLLPDKLPKLAAA